MNARNTVQALMIVGLAASLASRVYAQAWVPKPGEYYTEIRGSAWSSDHFYDDTGETRRYPGDSQFESRELLSYNEIGWKNSLGFVIGIPVRSVTLQPSANSPFHTETGLGDLLLALRYPIREGATALAAQVEWKAPLGYQNSFQPRLGQGHQVLGARLGFGSSFPSLNAFLEATSVYDYRFDGHDPLVHFPTTTQAVYTSANMGFWAGRAILVQGLYESSFSIQSTIDSSLASLFGVANPAPRHATLDAKTNYHSAGFGVTYRVDDRVDVFAKSLFQLGGRNVEQSNRYAVGVAFKNTRYDRLQGYLGGMRRH